jgi:hypothetical protein
MLPWKKRRKTSIGGDLSAYIGEGSESRVRTFTGTVMLNGSSG